MILPLIIACWGLVLAEPIQPAHKVTVAQVDTVRAELRDFLDAVAWVESRGKDDAVGDGGKAIGRYQIWRVYWADAVQHCPDLGGHYEDCKDAVYAERVVVAYLLRYAAESIPIEDYEVLARVHNGGPRGMSLDRTQGYWLRVWRRFMHV